MINKKVEMLIFKHAFWVKINSHFPLLSLLSPRVSLFKCLWPIPRRCFYDRPVLCNEFLGLFPLYDTCFIQIILYLPQQYFQVSSLHEPCFLFNIPSPGQQSFNPRNNSSEPLCTEKAESQCTPFS